MFIPKPGGAIFLLRFFFILKYGKENDRLYF